MNRKPLIVEVVQSPEGQRRLDDEKAMLGYWRSKADPSLVVQVTKASARAVWWGNPTVWGTVSQTTRPEFEASMERVLVISLDRPIGEAIDYLQSLAEAREPKPWIKL